MTISVLEALMNPQSVALIGASDNPMRIGGRPLKYLKNSGYLGDIYPINPNRESVQNYQAYSSLEAIKATPDVALLAVPATAVLDSVKACADKGVKSAIVFSAGFSEAGDVGEEMQVEMVNIAKEANLRLLGPNCLGVFNSYKNYYGTFSTILDREFVQAGPVAIVSQSGAYGSHIAHLCRERGLGVGYWITTGNECDLDISEALSWAVDQAEVKVVMVYAEGIRNRDNFIQALEKARSKDISIVFMKVGSSAVGARAISSHTAALAGLDHVFDAVLRQYGVFRAHTTAEQIDIAYTVVKANTLQGNKLGIYTFSGGFGIQMSDDAEKAGLDVAAMPEEVQAELKQLLPYASPVNPVDVTAQAATDLPLMTEFMRAMIEKGGYNIFAGILGSGPSSKNFSALLNESLTNAMQNDTECLKCLTMTAPREIIQTYEDNGFLVFEDGSALIHSLGVLWQFQQWKKLAQEEASLTKIQLPAPINIPQKALSEHEAKAILSKAGVTFTPEILVPVGQDPAVAADQIGYPLVMKIASADLPHKTEVGGVKLNLKNVQHVQQEMSSMVAHVRQQAPDALLDGVILSPMIQGGTETIVGVFTDPSLGPVVMFGLGGVFVEVLKDVTFRVAPFNTQEAHRMIREIKGFAMLEGVRGGAPSDINALAQMLSDLSQFAYVNQGQYESIDLNPVLVFPEGEGLMALDALIVT
ncbi:acetate--CoA ligase family protein [Acinetobacter sp. YH12255]|uniref:acetate--CoA ligase family protein n=1 Tax=Acinetobacter sp. YH12255 TaxID=2601179 RepID=UPI0015D19A52|nr:acetate--CoA ligase family protein [Acinetobacter sp. YH12255]